MQEESAIAFSLDGMFRANPNLTDYAHWLKFSPTGSVRMVDAAGHMVISIVEGCFSVSPLDARSIQVHFYDLLELHPYEDEKVVRALEPCSINVTREEGVYAFRWHQWVPKGIESHEWPCTIYWTRYFFEVDPLAQLSYNRRGSAYHHTMVEPDTRYYYRPDEAEDWLSVGDLAELGISPQPEAAPREGYRAKIIFGYR
jgi:hypothetical protein